MKYVLPALEWYPEVIRNEIVPVCMGRVFDRTETLDLGFDQHIISPIPEYRVMNDSWTEVLSRRAIELAKIAKDNDLRITVTYSGGMDSTSAIAAFMLYTDATIDVTYSDSTIEEWPEFYEHLKKHPRVDRMMHVTFLPFWMNEETGDHRMVVGGDPGDICFGSKMYRHDQKVWDRDGNEVEYNLDHWAPVWEGFPDNHRELFEPMVEKCPVDLENNYDLTWWLGFCIKWQLTTTRLPMMARFDIPNFYNFFDTEDCQLWAMNNNWSVKCPDKKWKNLKHPTKEHLYLFFQDESVWRQVKRDSLQHVWPNVMHGSAYRAFLERMANEDPEILSKYPHKKPLCKVAQKLIDIAEGRKPWPGSLRGKKPPRGQFGNDLWIDENWHFGPEWPTWGNLMYLWRDVELDGKY